MLTQKIVSSTIDHITFHAGEMTVAFKSGNRYRYAEVPIKIYFGMGVSKKPGTYYGTNIKKKFKSRKLNPGEI